MHNISYIWIWLIDEIFESEHIDFLGYIPIVCTKDDFRFTDGNLGVSFAVVKALQSISFEQSLL